MIYLQSLSLFFCVIFLSTLIFDGLCILSTEFKVNLKMVTKKIYWFSLFLTLFYLTVCLGK
jgi:hypothetical protein